MTGDVHERRRALVDLLPRFLMRRRVGWTGLQDLLAQHGLARPEFFLLRAIAEETDAGVGMTYAGLCANLFNPYSTIHSVLEALPTLVDQGYLVERDGLYRVAPAGRVLAEQVERGAHAYLTTLDLLPAADLARLTGTLAEIAERMWAAPEPSAKPHQARVRRLPPARDDQTAARLDQAVYGLWTARDDAHMAAWRAAGFAGPAFDILSRVWSGEAGTLIELNEALCHAQRAEDIAHSLDDLERRGDLARDGDALRLTSQGRTARDAIEAETDRVYFAPWPPLNSTDVVWLHDAFLRAYERLP